MRYLTETSNILQLLFTHLSIRIATSKLEGFGDDSATSWIKNVCACVCVWVRVFVVNSTCLLVKPTVRWGIAIWCYDMSCSLSLEGAAGGKGRWGSCVVPRWGLVWTDGVIVSSISSCLSCLNCCFWVPLALHWSIYPKRTRTMDPSTWYHIHQSTEMLFQGHNRDYCIVYGCIWYCICSDSDGLSDFEPLFVGWSCPAFGMFWRVLTCFDRIIRYN